MAVPYHTHTFEIPAATKEDVVAGVSVDKAVVPATLGTAAVRGIEDFATAAQGTRADSAVQPSRAISAGAGLTGGGTLSANLTFALNSTSLSSLAKADTALQPSRQVVAGLGMAGGGTLNTDITLSLSPETQSSLGRADSAVQPTRKLTPGIGLTGGGDLSADRSLALSTASISSLAKADTAVQPSRAVIAGTGLSGGGDLSADRSVALSTGTLASLAKADTAIQAQGGAAGQVLTKNSAADGDVDWKTVAAATAVSYAPQSLTEPQKQQARQNIGALDDAAIAGSPTKDTPIDADGVVLVDSADSGKSKRVLWSRVKAVLQAFFDNRYLRFIGGTLTGPLALLSPRSNAAVGDRNYTPAYIGRIGDANLEVTLFGEERVGTDVRAVISARSGSVINYAAFTHLGDLEVSRTVHCSDVRARGWLYSGTATFRTDGNIYGSKWNDRFGNWDAAEGIYARIEARGYARTRDYLLSEQVPIGGTAFLRYDGNLTNPQSIGGGDLTWTNVASGADGDGGKINYGTWQPVGMITPRGAVSDPLSRKTTFKRVG